MEGFGKSGFDPIGNINAWASDCIRSYYDLAIHPVDDAQEKAKTLENDAHNDVWQQDSVSASKVMQDLESIRHNPKLIAAEEQSCAQLHQQYPDLPKIQFEMHEDELTGVRIANTGFKDGPAAIRHYDLTANPPIVSTQFANLHKQAKAIEESADDWLHHTDSQRLYDRLAGELSTLGKDSESIAELNEVMHNLRKEKRLPNIEFLQSNGRLTGVKLYGKHQGPRVQFLLDYRVGTQKFGIERVDRI